MPSSVSGSDGFFSFKSARRLSLIRWRPQPQAYFNPSMRRSHPSPATSAIWFSPPPTSPLDNEQLERLHHTNSFQLSFTVSKFQVSHSSLNDLASTNLTNWVTTAHQYLWHNGLSSFTV